MILPPSKIKRDHLSGQTMSPSPKPMKYVIYKSYLPFPLKMDKNSLILMIKQKQSMLHISTFEQFHPQKTRPSTFLTHNSVVVTFIYRDLPISHCQIIFVFVYHDSYFAYPFCWEN